MATSIHKKKWVGTPADAAFVDILMVINVGLVVVFVVVFGVFVVVIVVIVVIFPSLSLLSFRYLLKGTSTE